jgi:short-subunit dehydrogenase
MLRPRPGRIVNISAMAGRVCLPYAEVYAAAKGAA